MIIPDSYSVYSRDTWGSPETVWASKDGDEDNDNLDIREVVDILNVTLEAFLNKDKRIAELETEVAHMTGDLAHMVNMSGNKTHA